MLGLLTMQSGKNDLYSIHNELEQSAYVSKRHPLHYLIKKTSPSTEL